MKSYQSNDIDYRVHLHFVLTTLVLVNTELTANV